MDKNAEVLVNALGTNPEWADLKKFLKVQGFCYKILLMFESDWEEFQIKYLGYYDKNIVSISKYNEETILSPASFFEGFSTNDKSGFIEKFQKTLPGYKKYVKWEISIGKVLEEIIIELDFSICPRTCENFWQISTGHSCLSYVNSKFHRVFPGVFIEGGLIHSETHSIYSDYFPDENYNYLHDRCGVLGMSKTPGNGTGFYITLRPVSYFNCKTVAFGRVVSGLSTIFHISESVQPNQQLIDQVIITKSEDFFKAKNNRLNNSQSDYRDILNEVLKHV